MYLCHVEIKQVLGCNDIITLSNCKTITYYAGRSPGNSPEYIPLDATLNQDAHAATNTQIAPSKRPSAQVLYCNPTSNDKNAYGQVHCSKLWYKTKHSPN